MAYRVELVLRTFLESDIYDLRKFSTLFAGGAVNTHNTQFKCIPVSSSSLPWPTSSLSALHIHCVSQETARTLTLRTIVYLKQQNFPLSEKRLQSHCWQEILQN